MPRSRRRRLGGRPVSVAPLRRNLKLEDAEHNVVSPTRKIPSRWLSQDVTRVGYGRLVPFSRVRWFGRGGRNERNRREAVAAVRSSGGPLTDSTPALHPLRREALKMPHSRYSADAMGTALHTWLASVGSRYGRLSATWRSIPKEGGLIHRIRDGRYP